MSFHQDFWTIKVDETVSRSHTNCFKYQPDEELHARSYYSSESRWSSLNPSSPESSNLNRNLNKRKGQADSSDLHRTNYAQKPIPTPGYHSSGSSTGSMSPPNSQLEKFFVRMELESTPRKEEIRIGLKPSERISYLREILPLQNQPRYISRSKWELMASPKAPLRRPNSPSSHIICAPDMN